jgi:hypothetical protein
MTLKSRLPEIKRKKQHLSFQQRHTFQPICQPHSQFPMVFITIWDEDQKLSVNLEK